MKNIAVDWDCTFVECDGYKGPGISGPFIPETLARVRQWLAEGHTVIIFTSRVSVEWEIDKAMAELEGIQKALKQAHLPELFVTANKYSWIHEFWDDRAFGVEKNNGKQRME